MEVLRLPVLSADAKYAQDAKGDGYVSISLRAEDTEDNIRRVVGLVRNAKAVTFSFEDPDQLSLLDEQS